MRIPARNVAPPLLKEDSHLSSRSRSAGPGYLVEPRCTTPSDQSTRAISLATPPLALPRRHGAAFLAGITAGCLALNICLGAPPGAQVGGLSSPSSSALASSGCTGSRPRTSSAGPFAQAPRLLASRLRPGQLLSRSSTPPPVPTRSPWASSTGSPPAGSRGRASLAASASSASSTGPAAQLPLAYPALRARGLRAGLHAPFPGLPVPFRDLRAPRPGPLVPPPALQVPFPVLQLRPHAQEQVPPDAHDRQGLTVQYGDRDMDAILQEGISRKSCAYSGHLGLEKSITLSTGGHLS